MRINSEDVSCLLQKEGLDRVDEVCKDLYEDVSLITSVHFFSCVENGTMYEKFSTSSPFVNTL